MKIFFIKCKSGYWAGLSREEKRHLYVDKKEDGAMFLDGETAKETASGWLSKHPLSYMKIKNPIEPFIVEELEFTESK